MKRNIYKFYYSDIKIFALKIISKSYFRFAYMNEDYRGRSALNKNIFALKDFSIYSRDNPGIDDHYLDIFLPGDTRSLDKLLVYDSQFREDRNRSFIKLIQDLYKINGNNFTITLRGRDD